MVSVTQGYRSHEPRDAKVGKKASLLVKAQLGKQDIPASSSFSWADRKKKTQWILCHRKECVKAKSD